MSALKPNSRDATRRASSHMRGFTLMESLVLIGILIILLSIFVPYLLSIRETSRRTTCAHNLEQIRNALQAYAKLNNGSLPCVIQSPTHANGYTAFTGPDASDPFTAGSAVSPNDVTASLWLLVRSDLIKDTRVFICPSSAAQPDQMINAAGNPVDRMARSNFRSLRNISYSYASPFSSAQGYRLTIDGFGGFALMADLNPGVAVAANAPPAERARGNSRNHDQVGQNVLYMQGEVSFTRTPYCGWATKVADNIYAARAAAPSTQAAELPAGVIGVISRDASPVSNDDSYLVPTALDATISPLPVPPATMPATTSTSTPATTSQTTTLP